MSPWDEWTEGVQNGFGSLIGMSGLADSKLGIVRASYSPFGGCSIHAYVLEAQVNASTVLLLYYMKKGMSTDMLICMCHMYRCMHVCLCSNRADCFLNVARTNIA